VPKSTSAKGLVTAGSAGQIGNRLLQAAFAENTHKQDAIAARHLTEFGIRCRRKTCLQVWEVGTTEFNRQDTVLKEFVGYLASKGLGHTT
jgi:hypothetical protein